MSSWQILILDEADEKFVIGNQRTEISAQSAFRRDLASANRTWAISAVGLGVGRSDVRIRPQSVVSGCAVVRSQSPLDPTESSLEPLN